MRSKPKKCDFVFNGKQYWITDGDWFDVSDGEDTDSWCLECSVAYFDTDEDVSTSKDEWNSEEFQNKAFGKATKLFKRPSNYDYF